jgi:hypothetical protein
MNVEADGNMHQTGLQLFLGPTGFYGLYRYVV